MKRLTTLLLTLALLLLPLSSVLAQGTPDEGFLATTRRAIIATADEAVRLNARLGARLLSYLQRTKCLMSDSMECSQFVGTRENPSIRTATGRIYPLVAYSEEALACLETTIPCTIEVMSSMPAAVDHRSLLSPIRDQGDRGTCTAHAVVAALEAFPLIPRDLSEQDAYCIFKAYERAQGDATSTVAANGGVFISTAVEALTQTSVCEEQFSPYVRDLASIGPGHENRTQQAVENARVGVGSFTVLDTAHVTDGGVVGSALAVGLNVLVDLEVAWDETTVASTRGFVDVVLDKSGQPVRTGGFHSMMICGFDLPSRRFMVRNSWGSDWGDSGYCYMTYDYLRTYARSGVVVLTPVDHGQDLAGGVCDDIASLLQSGPSVTLLGQ